MQKNKRKSIRVDVFFPVGFKKIGEDSFQKIKNTYIQHKTSDREKILSAGVDQLSIDLESRRFDKVDPGFVQFMSVMVAKLDLIINILNSKEQKKSDLDTGICENISSHGLFMNTSVGLNKGDFVELRIEFPVFPPLLIIALGLVMSVVKKDEGVCVAVNFVAINGDDREAVIGYVFKRQRELLRNKKNEVEET